MDRLVERLKKIGIDIELSANWPWIYLRKVNGTYISDKYLANHGFTAFWLNRDNKIVFSDRRFLFETIRKHSGHTKRM